MQRTREMGSQATQLGKDLSGGQCQRIALVRDSSETQAKDAVKTMIHTHVLNRGNPRGQESPDTLRGRVVRRRLSNLRRRCVLSHDIDCNEWEEQVDRSLLGLPTRKGTSVRTLIELENLTDDLTNTARWID